MKIRQGFVSNSSSSSFIILTSYENHEKVMKEFSEEEKKIVNYIMCNKTHSFDREILYGECYSGGDYSTIMSIADNFEIEDGDIVSEVWDKYVDKIKNNENETFSYYVDC